MNYPCSHMGPPQCYVSCAHWAPQSRCCVSCAHWASPPQGYVSCAHWAPQSRCYVSYAHWGWAHPCLPYPRHLCVSYRMDMHGKAGVSRQDHLVGVELAAGLLFVAQEILEPDSTWIITTWVVTSTVATLSPGEAGTRRLVALTKDKSLHLLENF